MTFPSFRRFIEESNDALAEIDGHGRILFVNRHWRHLVGEDGLEGGSVGAWPNIPDALLRAQSSEVSFASQLVRRAMPVEGALVRMVPNPEAARARLILRIRPAHAGLASTRDRFFTLIDQFPFAIGVHRDQRFLYVNHAAVRYLGYERPEELVGQPILGIIAAEEIAVVRTRVGHMMRTGQPLPERETKMLRKDGSTVVAELGAFMIRDEDGLPSYVVVARDVTERRLLEEKLRQGQRMEAVGRLAGGIAHDFNNILAVILTYAELLGAGMDADDVASSALEIQRAAERAAALVQQLLTFSRGHLTEARLFHPNKAINALLDFLKRSIGTSIHLETDLAPSVPMVRVGASHLEQILINLAINARDAMPSGGRLILRTRGVELVGTSASGGREGAWRYATSSEAATQDAGVLGVDPGRYVVIEVVDEGLGMAPETVSRAFEPFFTTKSPGKGTGLGLSTVYGIARQGGGAVEIESAPEVGTSVRVFLPAHEVEEVGASLDPKGVSAFPPGARILVVEDDEAVRILVTRILRGHGAHVFEARDAAQALAILDQLVLRGDAPPALLVTDVVMPLMSGPELAKHLRMRDPALPVVYMSGFADDHLTPEALGTRAWFLAKPFSSQELVKTVALALAVD
jgi:PAS domain S-box-containing protein